MNGLNLSNRFDPWAAAFLITLAAMAPLTALIGLAHSL
jgi:hypothetical protein